MEICFWQWHYLVVQHRPTDVERAFQLAKSGRYGTVAHILMVLKVEGYVEIQTTGPALRKQLAQLIRSTRTSYNGKTPPR